MLRNKYLPLTFVSRLLFMFLYIACGVVPAYLLAQDNGPTAIQITSLQVTKDEKDGQSLNIYFVATDSQGKVTNLGNLDSVSANLLLDVGNPSSTQAKLQIPQDPLYVVLVITARQRFSGIAQDIRKAAGEIVNNLPENSHIKLLVVSNNDSEPSQTTSFTQMKPTVIDEIEKNIKFTGAPCLYNSMIEAFDSVTTSDIPLSARRAIVLISDGNDQTSATSTTACSKTYGMNQVLEASTKNDIQIYTIPVQANGITLQDEFLRTLAGNSGGLYANDAKSVVDNATTVAGYLKGQILFAANTICSSANSPDNAFHSATLYLKTKDGKPLTDSFPFVLKTTCDTLATPVPIPLKLTVAALQYDYSNGTLPIAISKLGTDTNTIKRFCIEVKPESGQIVVIKDPFAPDSQVKITSDMLNGMSFYGKFTVIVTACDEKKNPILDNEANPIAATAEVTITQPTATPIPPTSTPVVPTAVPTALSPTDWIIKRIQSGDPLVVVCLVGIVAFAIISGFFVLRFVMKPYQDSTILPPVPTAPSKSVSAITVLPELMPPSQPTRMYEVISNVLPGNVNAEIKQTDKNRQWQVTHTPYKLGNNKRGIISNDIDFIDDQTVSDEQAEFHYRDEYFYVKNLGQNAILVNGEKVPKGLEVALKPNANTLQIGQKTMLEFYYEIQDDSTQVWASNAP